MFLKLGQYLDPFRTGVSAWCGTLSRQQWQKASTRFQKAAGAHPSPRGCLGKLQRVRVINTSLKAEASTENLLEVSAWERIAGAAFHGNEFI